MIIADKKVLYNSKEFKILFDQLFPSMCVLATRILDDEYKGKDIAQEAFIKLWQNPDENFATENSLKAYLYVLVRNACYSLLRKEKRITKDPLEQHHHLPSEKRILEEILREETFSLLHEAIKELSPQARKVIKLTLKGMTNEETAQELSVSINTVKTVKKRAYKALREKLGNQFMFIVFIQLIDFFN
uniref:RNA polymerase sigma factor n=1 Tax=uncultured Draconibacterium sp. TaxID=1573823 RepID=UPI003217DA67